MLNTYIDIQFRLYAYIIGYVYLALPYLLSFIIPPLKSVIYNFEEKGSKLSIFIISLISGSALFYVIIILYDDVISFSETSSLGLVGWYIGYFIWGYFALFLLADYRLKEKEKGIS